MVVKSLIVAGVRELEPGAAINKTLQVCIETFIFFWWLRFFSFLDAAEVIVIAINDNGWKENRVQKKQVIYIKQPSYFLFFLLLLFVFFIIDQ